MLDSFEMSRPAIEAAAMPDELGLARGAHAVVTLHRPSNVDDEAQLRRLADALIAIQPRLPIVFPVHPRTAARLAAAGLDGALAEAGVRLIDPVPYIRFMSLVLGAGAVITDSGGLQEETTYLGIPCFTLRDNTERPITIEEGTNVLATPATLPGLVGPSLVGRAARAAPPGILGRPDRRPLRRGSAAPRGRRMSIPILLPKRRRAWHERLAAALGAMEGDAVVDLSESGAGAGAGRLLRPLYDGSPDSAFLLGRLQRRECPYLEIVDETGETLAASYAAIEDKGDLERGADQAFARVEALLLRALAGQASPIPPRPERPPVALQPG